MPSIIVGVNQTIMMALGIVVIAALIGAGGLGREVLVALQRLQVGQGLEAGLAIVVMAVILDRLSHTASTTAAVSPAKRARSRKEAKESRSFLRKYAFGLGSLIFLAVLLVVCSYNQTLTDFPSSWNISLRGPVDSAVAWSRDNLYRIGDLPIGTGPLSDFVTINLLNPLRIFLQEWLPWIVVILAIALMALVAVDWRLALFTALGLFAIGLLGMWEHAMDTLSQTIVAVILALVIAIPIGVLAARSNTFAAFLRPVLDTLQTLPPFVYLVPVIMLFNVGRVPGIIASVLYALPPAIRLTNLGIREVSAQIIEAAKAFGSTPGQTLFKVQLPLALPSIMVGINQTIMMVLSMVIIAGLVGGGGLGLETVIGLAKNQTGRGVEAGLAIVILAIVIDRITQAWGKKRQAGAQH
jgi:glycine betaine/proline transport system permease protein